MRVAIVLERARIDGTVRVALREARGLRDRGHDVLVLCAEGDLVEDVAAVASRLIVEPALALGPSAARDAGARARASVALADRDAVLAVAGAAFPLAVAARVSAPVYLEILSNDLFVGDDPDVVAELHRAVVEGRVLGHALEDVLAHARRYDFAVGSVVFADLPVAEPGRRAPLPREAFVAGDELLVVTATRLDDDHLGYVRPLVRGIGALRANGYPLRLLVVGDGQHGAELRAEAPPFVTHAGFRHDLDDIYPLADVYVGEGSSRLEAALAGVPVVSSCAQTEPRFAEFASCVYGLNQGTLHAYCPSSVVPPTAFAEAIALLLDDNALRARVATRGRERVRAVHDVGRYLSFLEAYLAGDRRGSNVATAPTSVESVRGDDPFALERAAEHARANRALGVVANPPLSWRAFANLPQDCWDALADASRRAVLFGQSEPLRCTPSSSTAKPSPERP